MIASFDVPLPVDAPIGYTEADPQKGQTGRPVYIETEAWHPWFIAMTAALGAMPRVLDTARAQAQSAALGATPLNLGVVAAGLYRVTWRVRITQAATTSSKVVVTIGWTEAALPQTDVGPDITGNTTSTTKSGSVLIRVDDNSPVTYSTSYTSVGATPMQYEVEVSCEQVPEA